MHISFKILMNNTLNPINLNTIEQLFKQYYKVLKMYSFRVTLDEELAEDVVQDVFFELWQKRETLVLRDETIKSYLFKAVYNQSINIIKREERYVRVEDNEERSSLLDNYVKENTQSSEQSLLLKELDSEIKVFVQALPPQCRKVFILSRRYGLKNKDIAEQLDISVKAVEKHITKALFGLKEYLTEKGLFPIILCLFLMN